MTVTTLIPPPPYLCIGSANPISYRSGDGWIYWSAHVRPANSSDARTRVFRQQGAGPSQEVPLELYANARGLLSMEPDGLYLTAYNGNPVIPYRQQVPGFVVPAWPGGTAPPAQPVIDQLARNMAANAQTTATQAQVTANEAHVGLAARPTRAEVATIAWQKALDAIDYVWTRWYSYADKRLLDTIWDRVVLHLRTLKIIPAGSQTLNDPERWEG